jgi:hypothetical protein
VSPFTHTASAGKPPGRFRRFQAPLAWLTVPAVLAALLVSMLSGAPASGASTSVAFVQGTAFSTAKVTSTTVSMSKPVLAGDLLVGWSASGVQITVSASSATYLDGTVAEYSGVALAGPLDQVVAARGVGTIVNAGSTAAVPAGELVYSAVISGQPAGGYTPGSSQGISYTTRISADSGSLDESDITSSAAGSQQGTAILSAPTDWYSVAATFQPLPANGSPPTAPA